MRMFVSVWTETAAATPRENMICVEHDSDRKKQLNFDMKSQIYDIKKS